MTCWAIIPCKPSEESKRRLADALDAQARKGLVEAMLAHVAHAASEAAGVDRVCLIGKTRNGLPTRLLLLPDPGAGLNEAVSSAVEAALARKVERVVILAGDLPNITAQDVDALACADAIAIAPDRHGTGTNALSLPLPAARGFRFAYGPGSFERHRAEAERLGLAHSVVRSPGLEQDIDEPADLRDIPALLHQPG